MFLGNITKTSMFWRNLRGLPGVSSILHDFLFRVEHVRDVQGYIFIAFSSTAWFEASGRHENRTRASRLKYTSASRKRVTHTEQMKLRDKQKKSNQNVWVDGFLLERKFCERTLSKPSKSVQNPPKPFKTLGTGPYTGRDVRVRFSWRPLPSNRADFLKTLQISLYFLKTT